MNTKKRIFITGGTGFIGSHLINRVYQEYEVAVFSRNTSNPWRIKEALPHIQLFRGDLPVFNDIKHAIETFQPHIIFHFAAYGVNSKGNDYLEAIQTNIQGTAHLIYAAQYSDNLEKVINLGSSSEYGEKAEAITEEMLLKPVDIYGSTKASATLIAHQLATQLGINCITFRPFNLFGEGEESHKLFSYVIQQLLQDKEVLLTPCEQVRDYCYIQNIIDAFLLAIHHTEISDEIFNIGSGEVYPLRFFVDSIFTHMETDLKPQYGALKYRENERMTPQADISKVKRLLQWKPAISFEEGMLRTINWYKQHKDDKQGVLSNDN
ncbi:NAD-dependent epimerase/dehydratase family protein [Metabacillus sp. HB246100]|uniref:NAD-dependent epimerase/dehydratase family protein n=1 Tax=Bacillus weihaiensis TaxID=1547283 RepID=UPI0023575BD5|nr:NAD(P)-dependent oxidoreductase [Bacillus weihaiensis]